MIRQSPKSTTSVTEAFASVEWSLKDLPIHREALARDSAELFGALDRVRSYRAFLAVARAAKAAGRGPDLNRQVQARSRLAHADSAIAAASAGRVLRALHVSGAFARLTAKMAEALKASGPVKADDLWTRIRSTEAYRPCMDRSGVTDSMLEEFGAALARTNLTLDTDGHLVVVEGTIDGEPVRGRMGPSRPAAGLPRDPVDLLTAGRFLALCDSLERGEPAYLLGSGPRREPPSLEDLLMTDALAGQRESVRHVRKLDDVGLATYAGGDPATVAAILLAVAILGAIIVAAECDEEAVGGGQTSSCEFGIFLLTLGTAVLIGMALHDRQTQLNTLGGQNISGPLPQLKGPGS